MDGSSGSDLPDRREVRYLTVAHASPPTTGRWVSVSAVGTDRAAPCPLRHVGRPARTPPTRGGPPTPTTHPGMG